MLDDNRHAIPPYDAILLVSPRRANDARLTSVLGQLVDAIPVELMRQANARAASGKETPDSVAAWLETKISKRR